MPAAKASLRDHPWDGISRQNVLALFLDARVNRNRQGSTYVFLEPPVRPKDLPTRATLVARQLELTDAEAEEIIRRGLHEEKRADFLPIPRLDAKRTRP